MRKKSYIKKLRNPKLRGRENPEIQRIDYNRKGDYKRVLRRVSQVNRRIKELNKYDSGSYATKMLLNKIEKLNLPAKGRRGIRISQNVSDNELLKIENILNQYLKNETSTIRGIRRVEKRQKQHIKDVLGIDEKKTDKILTDEDVQSLYELFESEDFQNIIKKEYMEPSTAWIILAEAKKKNWTPDRFRQEFLNYAKATPATRVEDRDLQENIQNIYEKFMYYGLL